MSAPYSRFVSDHDPRGSAVSETISGETRLCRPNPRRGGCVIQGRIDEMAQLALKAWPDEPAQKIRQAGNKATGRESEC